MGYIKIFFIVSIGSLIGMVMGGLFGLGSGIIAPSFFKHIIVWNDVEPLGTATVFGGIAGVLLGGGLAVFAILATLISDWLKCKKNSN